MFILKAETDPHKSISAHKSFIVSIRVLCDRESFTRAVILSAYVHFPFVCLFAVVRVAQHEKVIQSYFTQRDLLLFEIFTHSRSDTLHMTSFVRAGSSFTDFYSFVVRSGRSFDDIVIANTARLLHTGAR